MYAHKLTIGVLWNVFQTTDYKNVLHLLTILYGNPKRV